MLASQYFGWPIKIEELHNCLNVLYSHSNGSAAREWSDYLYVFSMKVVKCFLCAKDLLDSSFRRRVASDPHVLNFLTSVAMITPYLLLDDTRIASKYFCKDCFNQSEKAVKLVDFLTPLIAAVRKSVRMSHDWLRGVLKS